MGMDRELKQRTGNLQSERTAKWPKGREIVEGCRDQIRANKKQVLITCSLDLSSRSDSFEEGSFSSSFLISFSRNPTHGMMV